MNLTQPGNSCVPRLMFKPIKPPTEDFFYHRSCFLFDTGLDTVPQTTRVPSESSANSVAALLTLMQLVTRVSHEKKFVLQQTEFQSTPVLLKLGQVRTGCSWDECEGNRSAAAHTKHLHFWTLRSDSDSDQLMMVAL